MSLNAKIGMGVKVLWNHHVVSELHGLGDLVSTVEKIDATPLDSVFPTYIAGRSAFSDLTMDCFFDGSESQWSLITAISSRKVGLWQIVSPPDVGPHAIDFRGFISERKLQYSRKGEASTWSLTVTPVEAPRECTQPHAVLKSLAIAGNGENPPKYTATMSGEAVAAMQHVFDFGATAKKEGATMVFTCVADSATVYVNGTACTDGKTTLTGVKPTDIVYVVVQPVDSTIATPSIYTISMVGDI